MHRETRALDDGYRSGLVPGLRATADAERLAEEMAFAAGRLMALGADPPDLYGEVRSRAVELEWATWACFLIAYLSPLEGEDPFAGIREALAGAADGPLPGSFLATRESAALPDLSEVALGPHTSHDRARGSETLIAYLQWVERTGGATAAPSGAGTAQAGAQERAFSGDRGWTPERRFERLFERLALPGLSRMGRYDLLLTLGRLGLYELRPGSLHLGGARGLSGDDPTTLAAKRVFGIGDPILLERRAAALAVAAEVPVETLDLALANWAAPEPATLGFSRAVADEATAARTRLALGL